MWKAYIDSPTEEPSNVEPGESVADCHEAVKACCTNEHPNEGPLGVDLVQHYSCCCLADLCTTSQVSAH